MALERPRRQNALLVLAYSGAFAVLAGLWALLLACNDRALLWYVDPPRQHYVALMYYGRWLRGAARALLTGSTVPTFDFSIGFGADILSTLGYYGIGDPLALTAMFVPSAYTELLYHLLLAVRVYLAGLAFIAFSRYHGNGSFGTLLGAVTYAFCAWTVRMAGVQPIFLIPLYCFPLVLLGADRIFDGRRPTLYIAAIALAALSNFLFFYMIAVLLVLYALAKYLHRYGVRQLRTLPGLVGRFVLYSGIGIAIAGATLLPTLFEMFGGVRFGLERQVTWYPPDVYLKTLANLTTADSYDAFYTHIGIAAPAVLAVLVLFAQKRRDTNLKLAWLGLFALLLIPWGGVMLNGFTYMSNRWVWAFALLEAFILARVAPRMAVLTALERQRLAVLVAGFGIAAFCTAEARTEWALAGFVLLLLPALFLLAADPARRPRFTRTVLLGGCLFGVLLNIGYLYGRTESDYLDEFLAPGEAWQRNVVANPANILKLLPDTGFWRYDSALNEPVNSAMLLDLHGTGYFWSLHNGYLSQLFSELGQNSMMEYEYKGLEGRAVLEALFGVKYYLAGSDRSVPLPAGVNGDEILAMDVGGTTVRVCENEAALPIGFTVSERMSRARYEALDPVQKQDALLSAVVLEDGAGAALPETAAENRVQVPETVVILGDGLQQVDEHTFYSPTGGGTLSFTVAAPPQNCESCFFVQGMTFTKTDPAKAYTAEQRAAMNAEERRSLRNETAMASSRNRTYLRLLCGGQEYFINYALPNNQYYCGRHDFVCKLGQGTEGVTEVKVVLAYAGYYHFDALGLRYEPVGDIAERTAPLREQALENVVLGANALTGDITVSTDKVLVIQVPYSRGWRAFVDGEPAELLRADTAFMGLELTPGRHTVELRYQTPGLAAGTACTAAGMLAFLFVALAPRLRRARRRKTDLQPA